MKNSPILFSTPMVQAILNGRKTQTRRIIKPQPYHGPGKVFGLPHPGLIFTTLDSAVCYGSCRYGRPGDTLWVREAFGVFSRAAGGPLSDVPGHWLGIQYKATENQSDRLVQVDQETWLKYREKSRWQRFKPAIHMPKWACRLTLTVRSIKPVPLQHISEEEAVAEGFEATESTSALENMRDLWNRLNAKRGYSWESNPWVWAIQFEVVR